MVKTLGIIIGIVFLAVGILGYIPNPIVGMDAGDLFATDQMHNLVHLASGIIILLASLGRAATAATTLKVFGVIYLILAVVGFWQIGSGTGVLLGLVEVNGADNWLHLVLGIVILAAGYARKGDAMMAQPMS
ncbi:MAG: DUF4383 domain-containing protein [bacterium]|nr:DUF4383 domain-containing protein [bacterium]